MQGSLPLSEAFSGPKWPENQIKPQAPFVEIMVYVSVSIVQQFIKSSLDSDIAVSLQRFERTNTCESIKGRAVTYKLWALLALHGAYHGPWVRFACTLVASIENGHFLQPIRM